MNKIMEQVTYVSLGVLGFALIWRFASGWVAWGAYLMIWSNNLQRPRLVAQKRPRHD